MASTHAYMLFYFSEKQTYRVLECLGQLHGLGLVLNKDQDLVNQYPDMDHRQAESDLVLVPFSI